MVDSEYNARRIRQNFFFLCGARSAVVSPHTEVTAILNLQTAQPCDIPRICLESQPKQQGVKARLVSLFRNIRSHITKKCRRTVPASDSEENEDNVACPTSAIVQRPILENGYANEVGEAFRAQVHVNLVRFSYVVASGYVVADAIHKGTEASLKIWKDDEQKNSQVRWAVMDTLVWQGLASVAIPGFTINRVCALSAYTLKRFSRLSGPLRKWTTTAIGLACIPVIIKPIDKSVDYFMQNTFRKWYRIGPEIETVVHHDRNH